MITEKITSIKVKEKTKIKLNKFKVHPRQSYEEVINKLVEDKNG